MARRIAVLSDVHGHLQALEAVLADAHAAGAQEVVVAGDMVNFGPNSAEVVDLLRERGAQMIRGNHEVELVATYGTPAMPPLVTTVRFAPTHWSLESLGAERRAYLAELPDRLLLDEATVVVHGSPRHVRDAVTAAKPVEELAAMWGDRANKNERNDPGGAGDAGDGGNRGDAADRGDVGTADAAGNGLRLAFVGHTHRPVVRDLPAANGTPARRFVNVGSAGFNLDGDTRTAYALVERDASGAPGDWQVEVRRVAYDVEAAVAAFENGIRQSAPEMTELFIRQLRTARSYFGPWLRTAADLPDEEIVPSIRRFLVENP